MKTVGIIAEYNPFHNGHKYHIEQARKITGADTVIVIMSGNFVQRGEPAILNKWKRAESALHHGADLIVELPTYYALSSAEMFAFGSISILDHLEVDTIVFGSEHGEISPFYEVAKALIELDNKHIHQLQKLMKDGHSFPTARALLLKKLYDFSKEELDLLNTPNNILGVEYIKAILMMNSNIKADTIKRKGSHYHSSNIDETIASATAIRQFLLEKTTHNTSLSAEDYLHLKRQVPAKTYEHIENSHFASGDSVFSSLRYKLMISNANQLEKIHDIREGIEYKILNSFGNSTSYNDLITKCKSKRYTYTRLSRIMMKILLGIQNKDVGYAKNADRPDYARTLGFTPAGAQFLGSVRKQENIQLVTNLKNYRATSDNSQKMLSMDILATNIYSEFDKDIRYGEDYYRQPHVIKTDSTK